MKKLVQLSIIVVIAFCLIIGGCTQSTPSSTPTSSVPTTTAVSTSIATATTSISGITTKPANVKVIKALMNSDPGSAYSLDRSTPFINAINTRLQGEVRIEFVGGTEIMAPPNMGDAVKSGVVGMLMEIGRGLTSSLFPAGSVGDLTQLTGPEERESGAFDVWSEGYAKYLNSKYIGMFDTGFGNQFHLFLTKPINKIDDLKGLRIRTYGVYSDVATAFGASPVSMGLTDVYTALQRNAIDGMISNIPAYEAQKIYEIAEYIINPGFYTATAATLVNLEVWNSLSKNAQDVIMEEAKKLEVDAIPYINAAIKKFIDNEVAAGAKVVELSPEESEKLIEIAYTTGWNSLLKQDKSGYAARLQPLLIKK